MNRIRLVNLAIGSIMAMMLAVALLLTPEPRKAEAQLAATIGTPSSYLSTASTNSTLVQSGLSVLRSLLAVNQTATVYYLKIYDKATAPNCGTDVPKWRIPLPASATIPTPINPDLAAGAQFSTGIGFCLTGALADNDSSNAAAGVAINFSVSRR